MGENKEKIAREQEIKPRSALKFAHTRAACISALNLQGDTTQATLMTQARL